MIRTSLVAGCRFSILLLAAITVAGWSTAAAQTESAPATEAAATTPAETVPAAEPSAAAEATEALESAASEAVDTAKETAEAVGSAAESATEQVGEAATAAGDAVAEAAGDAKQAVVEAAEEVEEAAEAAEEEGNLILDNLQPPQMAPWHGMHPVIVHVPIGLLLPVPVLVLIGMFSGKLTSLRWATFLLLVGGTIALFVAVRSGEAAGDYASVDETSEVIMHEHEELAEAIRWFYVAACGLYLLVLAGPVLGAWANSSGYWVVMHLLLLAVLGVSQLLLANVGHLGGELVHIHGITAELEE